MLIVVYDMDWFLTLVPLPRVSAAARFSQLNAALFQLAAGKNRAFEAVVLKLQEEMKE